MGQSMTDDVLIDELNEHIESLQALLALAKEYDSLEKYRQENLETILSIMHPIIQALTTMYGSLYQWYLSIGAPGGESTQEFNAWLGTLKVSSPLMEE